MTLSAPTKLVFIISLVLALIGILSLIGVTLPVVGALAGWSLAVGYVLLVAGVVLNGF